MDTPLHYQNPDWERAELETIRRIQLAKLATLLQRTAAQNDFYRDHWGAAASAVSRIDSLEAFAGAIPTVEKKHFVADQAACPPFGRRLRPAQSQGKRLQLFMTSGTSGQGQELHAQTEEEMAGTKAVYAHMYRWAGLKPGDVVLMTLSITMMAGGRLEMMGAEGYGLTLLPAGAYDVHRKLELIERFRPVGLVGTTSYFGHMSAVSPRQPPAPSVKALFTGGEGAGLAWYLRLEQEWRARVFDRYGSTQSRNDHMFSCEHGVGDAKRPGMLHNIDPMVLVEIVDPDTGKHVKDGEQGEIILTSLYHTDAPLIRCRMRDTAVYRVGRYCGCGRPYGGIEVGTTGRNDDMKKVKGVNIWPQAVDDLLFGIAEIDEYMVRLSTSGTGADIASIDVQPKDGVHLADAAAFASNLAESLRKKIGVRFEIRLVPRGTLQRSEYKARRWTDERAHKQ